MSRVLLAAVGDANDPAVYGGTPFHCLQAGRALGVIDAGLPLETTSPGWTHRRRAWNLVRLLTRFERGGYQYSEDFLGKLWARAQLRPDDTLINMFQLYPSGLFELHEGAKWFYIDQTLHQLFHNYAIADIVGRRIAADALEREQAQYQYSEGVICTNDWAAESLRKRYSVGSDRVHVVNRGANLDADALSEWEAQADHNPQGKLCKVWDKAAAHRPVRLVFVGKEWQRKGLDRLLRALDMARAGGALAELVVVGVDPCDLPPDLAKTRGVTWAGFIDKGREPARFLDIVASCDVGCLLSRAEAGAISLREFCRLGLPTIAPAVGGNPQLVLPEASDLVPPDAPDEEIAAIVSRLASDRDELERRRRLAFEARHLASWDTAVRKLGALVGSDQKIT